VIDLHPGRIALDVAFWSALIVWAVTILTANAVSWWIERHRDPRDSGSVQPRPREGPGPHRSAFLVDIYDQEKPRINLAAEHGPASDFERIGENLRSILDRSDSIAHGRRVSVSEITRCADVIQPPLMRHEDWRHFYYIRRN